MRNQKGLEVPDKGADEHQHAIDWFWHNYLSILENHTFPQKPGDGIETISKHTSLATTMSIFNGNYQRMWMSILIQKVE
jgi:hypothetical protein